MARNSTRLRLGVVVGCVLSAAVSWAASPDMTAVSVAINEFTFVLYRNALAEGQNNAVFSPVSLTAALAMAYAGAEGETADEIASVLCWGGPREVGLKGLQELIRTQRKTLNQDGCIWKTANRVWVQKGFAILDSYLKTISSRLSASVATGDFVRHAEDVRHEINRWVQKETDDLIPELLGPASLNPAVRMALINAAYFKGPWASAFSTGATKTATFYERGQNAVPVSMMQRDGRYSYLRDAQVEILRLPYRGYRASMLIILPRKRDGWVELERELTADQLALWQRRLQERIVHVEIPRFQVDAQFDLTGVLARMGMQRAVSDAADFSGMTGGQDLKIGQVIHRAKIRVDEEGAEAAAASGVMMQLTAALPSREPVVFRADHPFIFAVLDEVTQTVLFVGRLVNPSS